jgi:hypothetical protein
MSHPVSPAILILHGVPPPWNVSSRWSSPVSFQSTPAPVIRQESKQKRISKCNPAIRVVNAREGDRPRNGGRGFRRREGDWDLGADEHVGVHLARDEMARCRSSHDARRVWRQLDGVGISMELCTVERRMGVGVT